MTIDVYTQAEVDALFAAYEAAHGGTSQPPVIPPGTPPVVVPPVAGEPTATTPPSFGQGPFEVGATITRTIGVYPGSTPIAGRRFRNGKLIPGATMAEYVMMPEDIGADMTYEELVKKDDTGVEKPFLSPPVKGVKGTAPVIVKPPANAVQSAVDDMVKKNDGVLRGYEGDNFKNGWYIQGENTMGAHPQIDEVSTATWSLFYRNPSFWSQKCYAMLPWAVIFDFAGDQSRNTAVDLYNMRAFIKRHSQPKGWVKASDLPKLSGTNYSKPNKGLSDETPTTEQDGRIIHLPQDRNRFWHGWGGKVPINPDDVKAVFVRVNAKLVVVQGQADDRDKANIGLQVGDDYYLNMDQRYDGVGYAPSAVIARTRRITKDEQTFTCCTLTDDVISQNTGKTGITIAEFMADPPPID